jgi:hypothetical protein
VDEDGNLCYGVVEPLEIPCRPEPRMIYPLVRPRPGIEFDGDGGG